MGSKKRGTKNKPTVTDIKEEKKRWEGGEGYKGREQLIKELWLPPQLTLPLHFPKGREYDRFPLPS